MTRRIAGQRRHGPVRALGGVVLLAAACAPAAPIAPAEPSAAVTESAPAPPPAQSSAPPPPPPRDTEARIEPDGAVVVGGAGAMRRMPGPSGAVPQSRPSAKLEAKQFEALRQRIRRCYQQALQSNPDLSGKVTIRLVFGENGEAKRAEIVELQGASREIAQCLLGVVSTLTTERGEGERELVIPFVLAPAQ